MWGLRIEKNLVQVVLKWCQKKYALANKNFGINKPNLKVKKEVYNPPDIPEDSQIPLN